MSPALARRIARTALVLLHFGVALSAVASGIIIVIASLWPDTIGGFGLPPEFLDGSPFVSYLVPGIVLLLIVGGTHVAAFLGQLRAARYAAFLSSVAAFGMLIWIFVQMIFIPYSFLQAVFFVAGLAEAGFVLLQLGVLTPQPARSRMG